MGKYISEELKKKHKIAMCPQCGRKTFNKDVGYCMECFYIPPKRNKFKMKGRGEIISMKFRDFEERLIEGVKLIKGEEDEDL